MLLRKWASYPEGQGIAKHVQRRRVDPILKPVVGRVLLCQRADDRALGDGKMHLRIPLGERDAEGSGASADVQKAANAREVAMSGCAHGGRKGVAMHRSREESGLLGIELVSLPDIVAFVADWLIFLERLSKRRAGEGDVADEFKDTAPVIGAVRSKKFLATSVRWNRLSLCSRKPSEVRTPRSASVARGPSESCSATSSLEAEASLSSGKTPSASATARVGKW
jgi:hypothetical protein